MTHRSCPHTALLANCGLFVPAEHAVVPQFDRFLVRMSNSDSPEEGKSAYYVEMEEVRDFAYVFLYSA